MKTKHKLRLKRKPVTRQRQVEVRGYRLITSTYRVRNPRHAAELFRRQHGIAPNSIDGRSVMGFCENTGKAILEGDRYITYADEAMTLSEERAASGRKPLNIS